MKLTDRPGAQGGPLEAARRRDRHGPVLRSVEQDRGRLPGPHLVHRRHGPRVVAETLRAVPVRGEGVDDRVEEHEERGDAAGRRVLSLLIESPHEGGRGRQVPTRRAPARRDALGIDAQGAGVGSHEAHGALRVAHAVLGRSAVTALDPVLGADRDHASLRQSAALGWNCAGVPPSSRRRRRTRPPPDGPRPTTLGFEDLEVEGDGIALRVGGLLEGDDLGSAASVRAAAAGAVGLD